MTTKKTRVSGDSEGLLKSVSTLARIVEKVLEARAVAVVGESLSQTKIHILRLLGCSGPQTSTRVALYLGISKPAVTQMVDAMVGDKLLSRNRTKRDRREVELRLAPRGQQIFKAIDRQQHQMIRNATRSIPRRRLDEWAGTLQEITAALADADSSHKEFCLQCGAHPGDQCALSDGEKRCPYLLHGAQAARRAAAKQAASD